MLFMAIHAATVPLTNPRLLGIACCTVVAAMRPLCNIAAARLTLVQQTLAKAARAIARGPVCVAVAATIVRGLPVAAAVRGHVRHARLVAVSGVVFVMAVAVVALVKATVVGRAVAVVVMGLLTFITISTTIIISIVCGAASAFATIVSRTCVGVVEEVGLLVVCAVGIRLGAPEGGKGVAVQGVAVASQGGSFDRCGSSTAGQEATQQTRTCLATSQLVASRCMGLVLWC